MTATDDRRARFRKLVACDTCGLPRDSAHEVSWRGQRFCGIACASVAIDMADDEEASPSEGKEHG